MGASSGHLKQSIFETFNIYDIDSQHNQIQQNDTQQNNDKCSVENNYGNHTDLYHLDLQCGTQHHYM